jgi:D-arabinose 5-phosphate isomerase GutQ
LIESQEVPMTASDERVALRGICACAVRISQEEVSDFCSVLSLADRIFVAGSADATTLAALFRLGLAEFFGFDAHVLDTATVRHVEPADTVVAIAGPQQDAALTDVVRIVGDTQAALLAVATHRTPLLLRQADAAITVPFDRRNGIHDGRIHRGCLRPHVTRRDPCHPSGPDTTAQPRQPTRCSRRWLLPPDRAPVGSNSTLEPDRGSTI